MAIYGRDSSGRFISRETAAAMAMLESIGVSSLELEGFIQYSPVVLAAKRLKANQVAEYWRSIAPVRGDHDPRDSAEPTAYGTNWADDYRDSIQVFEDADGVVYVGSDLVPLADWLEYGSIHNPDHGYGAQTLAHFGGSPVDEDARMTHGLFVG